jgi:hypothetical protein
VKVEGLPPLWSEAVLGATYDEHTKVLEECGAAVDRLIFDERCANEIFRLIMRTDSRAQRGATVRGCGGSDIPVANIVASSPFAFAMAGLSQYRSTKERRWQTPAIVIVGETLEDFALYFGLSRIRSHAYWLLPSWIDASKASKAAPGSGNASQEKRPIENFAGLFADALMQGLSSSTFKRVAFFSCSCSPSVIQDVVDQLDAASIYSRMKPTLKLRTQADFPSDLKALFSEPEVVFNTDNFAVPTTQQVEEGQAAGFFPTPKPKGFTKIVPYDHRWITELRIEDHLYPRHPSLGEWLVRHHLFSTEEVRTGSRGVCYCCPSPAYFGGDVDTILIRPQLYVPSGPQLFERLAQTAGWTSKLSDKGFYSRDTIEKFGGLSAAASAFREPRHFSVLTEYLKDAKAQGAGGKFLSSDRRRYLDLPSIITHLGAADEVVKLIDELVQKRILHRGLILKCDFCRNADWFALGDVDDGFTCKRCRRSQEILSRHALQDPEPKWYYQLDEIAYQGLRNDMHVPILALDHLRKNSSAFLYADELEVWEPRRGLCCCRRMLAI